MNQRQTECSRRRISDRAPHREGDVSRAEKEKDPLRVRLGRLTKAELAVATLVARGLSNREIAGRVHLSPETVKCHVAAICRKLGARNRAHAAFILGAITGWEQFQ